MDALGLLDLRLAATIVVVPSVLLGTHFRARWRPEARTAFLAFLCLATAGFGASLAALLRQNLRAIPEWDFLGFWLHARTAAAGLDFYDPRNAQLLAAPFHVSEAFREEIVDVGFWYPPPSMFLFLPLGWFGPKTALLLWYGAHLAILALVVVLLWRIFFPGGDPVELLACATLVCAAHGTWLTFYFSQTTLAALLAVLLFWRRRESAWGGIWLAVGFFVKPFLAALVLVPILARRARACTGVTLAAGALALAALAVFGARTCADYFVRGPVGAKPDWIYTEITNQSLLGFFLRASGGECGAAGCVADPRFLLAAACVGALTLVLAFRLARAHDEWALSLCLLCALLVYPVSQVFYSVLLVPVLLLLWRERARLSRSPYPIALGSAAVYALMTANEGAGTVAAFAGLWGAVALVGVRLLRSDSATPAAPVQGASASGDRATRR